MEFYPFEPNWKTLTFFSRVRKTLQCKNDDSFVPTFFCSCQSDKPRTAWQPLHCKNTYLEIKIWVNGIIRLKNFFMQTQLLLIENRSSNHFITKHFAP